MSKDPKLRKLDKKLLEDLWRGLYHLPVQQAPSTAVLKGHLCAEVLIRRVVSAHMSDSSVLEDARLSFHQVLCLAQGFSCEHEIDWIWDCCRELNRLRNVFSHSIDAHNPNNATVNEQVEEFVRKTEKDCPFPFDEGSLKHYTRLDLALRAIYCGLLSVVHDLENEAE